ncbi:MAG: sulfotransferase [Cyanobacteria bacterium P01_D01_bin.105]
MPKNAPASPTVSTADSNGKPVPSPQEDNLWPKPRLRHPLMGSDLRTLLTIFLKNGFGRYPLHFVLFLATALARWPFSTYERWWVSRYSPVPNSLASDALPSDALPSDALASDALALRGSVSGAFIPNSQTEFNRPPIFILGHWRSGTTFLYNVLSRSPQFAYLTPLATGLPWDFLTLGKALEPMLNKALPEGRFIDNVPVKPDSPQEDEIALASMQTLSFYHGLYFPKRFVEYFNAGIFLEGASQQEIHRWEQTVIHFYKKLRLQNPGKQLLIKNPVYTARVAHLRRLYPNAKFIHIYRNPYRVFHSTENFYRKLFPELAFQPFNQVPVREVILSSYPKMMNALYRDVQDLPKENFIEFNFESFESDPISQFQIVYAQLGLENWEIDKSLFQQYLSEQKHYRKNKYAFSPESIELVSDRWQPFLSRWGYSVPGIDR